MIKSAQKAARALKRDFGEVEHLQVSLKGPADFVTAADHRAEDILYEELNRARPGYSFLGEEGGRRAGTDTTHTWIVDPLDGTMNFLHGIPHFAISLALEREAGGYVTDLAGGDAPFVTGNIVAGNEAIHRELMRTLKESAKAA